MTVLDAPSHEVGRANIESANLYIYIILYCIYCIYTYYIYIYWVMRAFRPPNGWMDISGKCLSHNCQIGVQTQGPAVLVFRFSSEMQCFLLSGDSSTSSLRVQDLVNCKLRGSLHEVLLFRVSPSGCAMPELQGFLGKADYGPILEQTRW